MSDFQARQVNKKKKFVADGIFNAELHEYLMKALKDYGYGGVTVRASAKKTKIMPKLARGKEKKTVSPQLKAEITRHLVKRFGFDDGSLKLEFDTIQARGLCAAAQCESLVEQMASGKSVRFCAMRIIKNVMNTGRADGCEVVITGKLRQQRAKAMKYKSGYIVSTGHPKNTFVDEAIRHIFLKQGVMGIRVKVMLPYKFDKEKNKDSRGGRGIPGGVDFPLPDKIVFNEVKQIIEEDILPEGHGVQATAQVVNQAQQQTPQAVETPQQ